MRTSLVTVNAPLAGRSLSSTAMTPGLRLNGQTPLSLIPTPLQNPLPEPAAVPGYFPTAEIPGIPQSQAAPLAELDRASANLGTEQTFSPDSSDMAGEKGKSNQVWDGSASAPVLPDGSLSKGNPGLNLRTETPATGKDHSAVPEPQGSSRKLYGFAAAAAAATTAAGALPLPAWLAGVWLQVKDFAFAGGILLATFGANRLVRWGVEKLGKSKNWHPDTTDKVRFVSSLATWSSGVTYGLAHFGASGPVLASTIGVGVTLAVTDTVSNFVHAVMLLLHKPYRVGETVRVGDTLYSVENLTLKHVELRVVGKLMENRPTGSGSDIVPLSELDGFHREADDKGRRYVQKITAPDGKAYIDRFEYTQLADKPVTVFRPYVKFSIFSKPSLPQNPLKHAAGAFLETPKSGLKTAVFWTAVAAGLIYGLPLLKAYLAWGWLQAAMPYLQGAASLLATGTLAGWLGRFAEYFAKGMKWSRHATAVLKLVVQLSVYTIGGTLALRTLGLEWKTLTTAFGATAAAFTFTQRDMLTNVWRAVRLRFDKNYRVGDILSIGDYTGKLVEINTNYLVIETAPESYSLLPLSYVKLYPIRSIIPAMKTDAARPALRD